MQFYVILLPYITLLPISWLMENLIIGFTASKDYKIRRKAGPNKCKSFIVTFITTLTIIGCILIMFIIAANKTVTEQRAWSGFFFFFVLQDLLIVPLVYMGFNYILFKLVKRHDMRMKPALHYTLYTQLNRDLEDVYVRD